MTTKSLELATGLAERGFRTFPLRPGSKVPAVSDWQTEATAVPLDLITLFVNDNANIGIACGSDFVAVDFDTYKDGAQTPDTLGLPVTFTVRTPRGGRHLYFKANGQRFANSVAKIAPGVDVRSEGGYVVAPGSVVDGRRYEIEVDVPPTDLPAWLAGRLAVARTRSVAAGATVGELDTPGAVERARTYLLAAPPAAEGVRNSCAYKHAARAYDFGLTPGTCFDLVSGCWNERNEPPLDDEELRRTTDSAATSRQNAIGSDNPAAGLSEIEEAPPSADQGSHPDMSILHAGAPPPPAFPVGVFGSLAPWLQEAAASKSAPVDYVAAGVIATSAALIGTARRVRAWGDWREPCILWAGLIGNPSSGKSPALDVAKSATEPIEQELGKSHGANLRKYEADKLAAETVRGMWERSVKDAARSGKTPPTMPESAELPQPPQQRRVLISDATTEAVQLRLSQNTRGLLLFRDEMSGWLGNLDRYGGSGGDRAFFLESYGGRPFTVDRKSVDKPLKVPFNSVCILGGIQPDRLREHLTNSEDDGLAARFLWFWPDPVPFRRQDRTPSLGTLDRTFRRLSGLTTGPLGDPVDITLSPEAAAVFENWCAAHVEHAQGLHGKLGGAAGKMQGGVLRLALVLEHLEWANGDESEAPSEVSRHSLEAAVLLVENYFKPTLRRVFGEASETKAQRAARQLARAILSKGDATINLRDVCRNWKVAGIKSQQDAEAAFHRLSELGWLSRLRSPKTGRPPGDYAVHPKVLAEVRHAEGFGSFGSFVVLSEADVEGA